MKMEGLTWLVPREGEEQHEREMEMLVAALLINLDTIKSLKVELHVRGSELRKDWYCVMLWWLTLRERRVLFPDCVSGSGKMNEEVVWPLGLMWFILNVWVPL
jgi:hypothetical protein